MSDEVTNCWQSFRKLLTKEKSHKLVIRGKANKSCCGCDKCQLDIVYNEKEHDDSTDDIIITRGLPNFNYYRLNYSTYETLVCCNRYY